MPVSRATAVVSAELAAVEKAYRKSRFTIICHAVFLVLCAAITFAARRMLGLSPPILATVVIVALVLFGKDIMTFFHLRSRLARLRAGR